MNKCFKYLTMSFVISVLAPVLTDHHTASVLLRKNVRKIQPLVEWSSVQERGMKRLQQVHHPAMGAVMWLLLIMMHPLIRKP